MKDEVAQRLSDTKAAKEVKSLERFQNLLMEDPDRAFYGRSQVILFFYARRFSYRDVMLMSC